MALLYSYFEAWFDDKTPAEQFAAYSLIASELGRPPLTLAPEVALARKSEPVKLWYSKMEKGFVDMDREATLDHLRRLETVVLNTWEADFIHHRFLPSNEAPLLPEPPKPVISEIDSEVLTATRRLMKSQLLADVGSYVLGAYLLENEEGYREITTSQLTTLLKVEGISTKNPSATILNMAQKAAPDFEIIGKTNRGKRQEWIFRLTPAARAETREKLHINAGIAPSDSLV